MMNINDFRIQEELDYYNKIRSHPGIKKLEILFPDQQNSSVSLNELVKKGVRITRSTRKDIFEIIEDSFNMFGYANQDFDVFAIKELESGEISIIGENVVVSVEEELPFFIFIHDILKTLELNEIKSVIGHEVGHFLLGHSKTIEELSLIQKSLFRADELGILSKHYELAELNLYYYLLRQLQELSADRIGLIVSKDLKSAITGLVKLAGGYISENINIDDYIDQAIEPEDKEDIEQIHPYGPNRSKALRIFSETDLYQKVIGKEGGVPLSEFSEILPDIVPLPEDEMSEQFAGRSTESILEPNDYFLELFFYKQIALLDNKATAKKISKIMKFVPLDIREEIFQRWTELNEDLDSKADEEAARLVEEFYAKAALKDSAWKTKIIRQMIKVLKADYRVLEKELEGVAFIADKIHARKECSKQFLKEFGYDPFA